MSKDLDFSEITITELHAGYGAGAWSARDVVAWYLDRIRRLDRQGPALNSVISVNEHVEAQAAELDAQRGAGGAMGPLHGVPVLVKDQIDVAEMPTTCGSVLFRDNWPKRDAFVISRLREAGALMLGKTTLGEMGAGEFLVGQRVIGQLPGGPVGEGGTHPRHVRGNREGDDRIQRLPAGDQDQHEAGAGARRRPHVGRQVRRVAADRWRRPFPKNGAEIGDHLAQLGR
mgnify:CR=1 FL=1